MNKIPVGQTIRFAYAFTFGQIGSIIGLIWIPTLVYAVANFFIMGTYYRALADSFEAGAPPAGPQALLALLMLVVIILLTAMIGVSVVQQAMGLRKGSVFAHAAFGRAELYVAGGYLALLLILLACFFVFVLILAVIGTVAARAIQANAGGASLAVAATALFCVLGSLYVLTRLSFVLIPAVVDGADHGLRRSWTLTKGNFWRIIAVGLATVLPVWFAMNIATSLILGPGSAPANPGSVATVAELLHLLADLLRIQLAHWPALVGLSFVISPLFYGLTFSSSAFAYRVLSGKAVTQSNGME